VLALLALAQLAKMVTYPLTVYLRVHERTREASRAYQASAVATIALVIPATYLLSSEGAAALTVVIMLVRFTVTGVAAMRIRQTGTPPAATVLNPPESTTQL
jgi:hypothetical protein